MGPRGLECMEVQGCSCMWRNAAGRGTQETQSICRLRQAFYRASAGGRLRTAWQAWRDSLGTVVPTSRRLVGRNTPPSPRSKSALRWVGGLRAPKLASVRYGTATLTGHSIGHQGPPLISGPPSLRQYMRLNTNLRMTKRMP
jgi:hypothetical protein